MYKYIGNKLPQNYVCHAEIKYRTGECSYVRLNGHKNVFGIMANEYVFWSQFGDVLALDHFLPYFRVSSVLSRERSYNFCSFYFLLLVFINRYIWFYILGINK